MARARLLFALCASTIALPAQAATLCVKAGGGGGCEATIQGAVDAAAAGDVIKIGKGTYFEAVVIPAGKDGLILKGGSPQKTIIDAAGLAGEPLEIGSNDVQVLGVGVHENAIGPAIEVNGNGFVIKKSQLISPDAGDCLEINGNDAVVEGNRFFGCGSEGIDLAGDNGIIRGNRVLNGDGGCINLESGSENVLIEKNVLENCEDDDAIELNNNSHGVMILKNRVYGADGLVEGFTVNDVLVSGNRVLGSESMVDLDGENPQVLGNTGTAVDEIGMDIDCSTDCSSALIEKNRILGGADDQDCFELEFDTNGGIVRDNTARLCTDAGFDIGGAGAVLIEGNTASRTAAEGDEGFEIDGAGVKTVRGNRSNLSGGAGFEVFSGGAHVLEDNVASDNAKDGFKLLDGAGLVTLTGNKATGNAQEGIDNRRDAGAVTLTDNKVTNNRSGSDVCSVNAFVDGGDNKFGSPPVMACLD